MNRGQEVEVSIANQKELIWKLHQLESFRRRIDLQDFATRSSKNNGVPSWVTISLQQKFLQLITTIVCLLWTVCYVITAT